MHRRTFLASLLAAPALTGTSGAKTNQVDSTIGDVKRIAFTFNYEHYFAPDVMDMYSKHVQSFGKYILRRYYCMSLRGEVPHIKHLVGKTFPRTDIKTRILPIYLEWPYDWKNKEYATVGIYAQPVWKLRDHNWQLIMLNGVNPECNFKPYTCSGKEGSMDLETYNRCSPFIHSVTVSNYLPCDDIEIYPYHIQYTG